MTVSIGVVTLDCDNPLAVSHFWAQALGATVDDGASDFFASINRDAQWPRMFFIKVPEAKTAKNRMHLDLTGPDREAEVERLTQLGATVTTRVSEWGHEWVVMADPEGNEFCVSAAREQ